MTIDKETYKLPDNNYHKKVYKKTQIVIGHNSRKDMRHFNGWIHRHSGKYKKTTTYSIEKDGTINEHFDPKYYSDLLDIDQDKSNISISLVNIGWLKLDVFNDVYVDWLGHIYSNKLDNIITKPWRGHDLWVKYTDEQMESLKSLVSYLCDEFDIVKESIGNNVYDENVDIYNGVVFRSNYSQEIKDISPAFDMDTLKEL